MGWFTEKSDVGQPRRAEKSGLQEQEEQGALRTPEPTTEPTALHLCQTQCWEPKIWGEKRSLALPFMSSFLALSRETSRQINIKLVRNTLRQKQGNVGSSRG